MEVEKKHSRKSKVKDGMSRFRDGEASVIRKSLGNFIAKGSKGEKIIEEIAKCPIKDISKDSIVNLADSFSLLILKKNLGRKYKRNKALTIKFVNDNSDLIELLIPHITVHYENS